MKWNQSEQRTGSQLAAGNRLLNPPWGRPSKTQLFHPVVLLLYCFCSFTVQGPFHIFMFSNFTSLLLAHFMFVMCHLIWLWMSAFSQFYWFVLCLPPPTYVLPWLYPISFILHNFPVWFNGFIVGFIVTVLLLWAVYSFLSFLSTLQLCLEMCYTNKT